MLFTDIVGSADLKVKHGVPAYSEALRIHNSHFERLARECHLTILQNMGDGYFAEAGGIAEALRFALLFQDNMRKGPWSEVCLTTRVGIHAGEVSAVDSEGGSGIVAPAADMASRVMSLAMGCQILLTKFVFDEARHFVREHPAVEGTPAPPLAWLAHGPYLLKGCIAPVEIFEVGAEGLAPLAAPPNGEKAHRAIRPGEEETLGWRPATGLEIPGRQGWHLTELLGAGGFGEVWAGEHGKLRQRRAFKFCFDDERLRALKREVTLVRLLQSALGQRDDIVHLHELKLDEPPFYLESDLAPHGNLIQWAEKQGGLDQIPLERRIAIVAHTATALASAHSLGVLHKDIKPTNILIFDGPDGEPRPRLVDFGIGTLADPAVLGLHGVTSAGFTRATIDHSTGTPTYSPPEYLAGRPYTIQGDIYGLGVLLYQLVTAKPLDPLAVGWEREISDPLLRADIAACVDGDPSRRLPSAADLAERLERLDQRRTEIEEQERLEREAAARAEAQTAAEVAGQRAARLRKLTAAYAVLALLAITASVIASINQQKVASALGKLRERTEEVETQRNEVEQKNTKYRGMLVEAARSDRFVAAEQLRLGLARNAFAYLARACDYDPLSSLAAEKAVAALNTWQHALPVAIIPRDESHGDELMSFPPRSSTVTSSSTTKPSLPALMPSIPMERPSAPTGIGISGGENSVPPGRRNHSGDGGSEHQSSLWSVSFSPDGPRFVTVANDKTARVCDTVTGRSLAILEGHEALVTSVHFSPDGSRIVTASSDKNARVWDASTGQNLFILAGHRHWVRSAQFSPDGTRIVTASQDNTAKVWDAATGNLLATLEGHEKPVWSARFSPDSQLIVTASDDETARVWHASDGTCLFTLAGHKGWVTSAQFSPDGSRLITSSDDSTARMWDTATGKCLVTFNGHNAPVWFAGFSPDGKLILTASDDKTARVWSFDDRPKIHALNKDGSTHVIREDVVGQARLTLAGHQDWVATAQFSPDGTRILTASHDSSARVWDASTGKGIAILSGHRDWVVCAQFSPDGARIVTASDDKTVRVWNNPSANRPIDFAGRSTKFSSDGKHVVTIAAGQNLHQTARVWYTATGKSLAILDGHTAWVWGAEFSPDGTRIVTASSDKTARVWDAATGKSLATLVGHTGSVEGAQFSPDGTCIVTASSDKTARVWDAATGKSLAILVGHADSVKVAEFSPDGTRIVTASFDKTAKVWDTVTGKSLAILAGHTYSLDGAQFSPDGTRIVTASHDNISRVWDATTGKCHALLSGHRDLVESVQFSTDGTRIVTASRDKTSRVWNAATGKCLAILEGHTERVMSAQFNRDGTRIVTASDDKTGRVWNVATGKSIIIISGNDMRMLGAQFSPDGTRIAIQAHPIGRTLVWDPFFLSDGYYVKLWNILPAHAGPPPEWFPDFLRYLAQMRLNPDGELETLKPNDWLVIRKRLREMLKAGNGHGSPYFSILRRFVSE